MRRNSRRDPHGKSRRPQDPQRPTSHGLIELSELHAPRYWLAAPRGAKSPGILRFYGLGRALGCPQKLCGLRQRRRACAYFPRRSRDFRHLSPIWVIWERVRWHRYMSPTRTDCSLTSTRSRKVAACLVPTCCAPLQRKPCEPVNKAGRCSSRSDGRWLVTDAVRWRVSLHNARASWIR